jgi:hypothetical protein
MAAENNISIYQDYEGILSPLRTRQKKYDQFYANRQYSNKERAKLRSIGLKPLVINICRPLLAQQLSILVSSRPTWKVVPLRGADKNLAGLIERYLVGKWNSDYIDIQYELAAKDQLIVGCGFLMVDLANILDDAVFDFKIKHVSYKYVYPDPNAVEYDLSDAENIIIAKKVGIKYAQVAFQLSEADVKTVSDIDSDSQQVTIIDRFSKYPVERIEWQPKKDRDGSMPHLKYESMPPSVFYSSKLENKVEAERKKWIKELESLRSNDVVELKNLKDLNIYRCLSVGQHTAYEGIMNIRAYPVISFIDEIGASFKELNGETVFIEGMQEIINKFYMLTIHNAMLTGNTRYLAEETTISDKTQFQRTSSIPGAVVTYKGRADLPDGGRPQQMQSTPLASAFYNLANDLMQKAEYETSVFAPSQGNPKGSPETFSTVASLQNFAGQRISRLARRNDIMLSKVGEVCIQFIQNYTDENELLTYVDDKQLTDEGTINPSFGQEVELGKINDTVINEGVIKEIKNDARIGQFALKVLTQPNLGTDRLNKAAFMSNMIMNKALPATPMVLKTLFDLMEVPHYQAIIADIMANSSAEAQVGQLTKMIKELQLQNKNIQQEAIKLMKQNEVEQFKGKLNEMKTKVESQLFEAKSSLVEEISNKINGDTNV